MNLTPIERHIESAAANKNNASLAIRHLGLARVELEHLIAENELEGSSEAQSALGSIIEARDCAVEGGALTARFRDLLDSVGHSLAGADQGPKSLFVGVSPAGAEWWARDTRYGSKEQNFEIMKRNLAAFWERYNAKQAAKADA